MRRIRAQRFQDCRALVANPQEYTHTPNITLSVISTAVPKNENPRASNAAIVIATFSAFLTR